MTVKAGTREEAGTVGRVWVVRLDPDGRPPTVAVRLSCSRPSCPDERLPSTADGRRAAVEHVNAHLARIRADGGPRGAAWCGCRAAGCAWHTPATARTGRPASDVAHCEGPVVLSVYADRAGRLWRIAETCARCAAAIPGCRVLATAPRPAAAGRATGMPGTPGAPGTPRTPGAPGTPGADIEGGPVAATFSDRAPALSAAGPSASAPAPAQGPRSLPRARTASPGRRLPRPPKPAGKIAQRIVPHDLQPEVLRLELAELGDAFRAYQQCPEPDLTLLAALHERKARAFALWGDVTGDKELLLEADRARKAVETTLMMRDSRVIAPADGAAGGDVPPVERLLTRGQAELSRTVLGHVRTHAPRRDAGVHLAVLMLALRAARTGAGNVTGQDLTGWLQADAERVLAELVATDWLHLPDTVEQVLASRPEHPTAFTVPELLPDRPTALHLGKLARTRLSGWAQKVVGDRKIRKKKLPVATRLLALYTTAHISPDGRLGHAQDEGLRLDDVAAFCALSPEEVAEHAERLTSADWLTDVRTTEDRLHGRLTARVLPYGGLLSHPSDC
ncbi:hypothetical protein [Streptomyces sp. NPDC048623]|uniref:hypothetical protein n=1 Tax=Streptomyces sp. NPDC048623 TaxID=3155761 RepID=UPI0034433C38